MRNRINIYKLIDYSVPPMVVNAKKYLRFLLKYKSFLITKDLSYCLFAFYHKVHKGGTKITKILLTNISLCALCLLGVLCGNLYKFIM